MAIKIKPILVLGITCGISSFLLTRVYQWTGEKIERQKEKALQEALSYVLPSAVRFEKVDTSLFFGYNERGEKVGLVFSSAPRGYAGPILIICGLGIDGRITGIRIASPAEGFKETPGLGSKVREKEFLSQFLGKEKEKIRLKREGGEISAITAATISSKAVCEGIRKGVERYERLLR
jgi:electron transport complex protein RnfG